jgi:hypothetical protein
MKKLLKLKLLGLVFLVSISFLRAGIYSIVTSQEKIEGKVDCYLVKYSIYDDNNTLDHDDDKLLGKYTTVVGDCNDANSIIYQNTEFFEKINLESEDFFLTPNPATDFIEINNGLNFDNRKVKWSISNIVGNKVLNGDFNSAIEKINISTLVDGMYIFSIFEDDKINSKKFLIN